MKRTQIHESDVQCAALKRSRAASQDASTPVWWHVGAVDAILLEVESDAQSVKSTR